MIVEHTYFPHTDLEFIAFSALVDVEDMIFDKIKKYIPLELGLGANIMKALVGYVLCRYIANKWVKMLGTVFMTTGIGSEVGDFVEGFLAKI